MVTRGLTESVSCAACKKILFSGNRVILAIFSEMLLLVYRSSPRIGAIISMKHSEDVGWVENALCKECARWIRSWCFSPVCRVSLSSDSGAIGCTALLMNLQYTAVNGTYRRRNKFPIGGSKLGSTTLAYRDAPIVKLQGIPNLSTASWEGLLSSAHKSQIGFLYHSRLKLLWELTSSWGVTR